MANAPNQRLALLQAFAFQERLRAELLAKYGRWHRADGAGLGPDAWFELLAVAVQAEARDWDDAVSLCDFLFAETLGNPPSDWAVEVLSREQAQTVFEAALRSLRPEMLDSPEAAKGFFQELRHQLRDSHGWRGREVMDVLRAALTGDPRGPCLGIVAALLGPARVRQRLEERRHA